MLHGISKQQKQKMLDTRLNNFPVSRNYRNIDFALRCMDVLATNLSELKFDAKFCELEAEDFQATFTSYWPNVGVEYLEKF